MKKIIYILLTATIFLSACSTKEEIANSKTQPETEETSAVQNEEEITTEEATTEEVITTTAVVTADYPEYTGEVEVIETDNVYEYFNVLRPFPEDFCFVDSNKYFYDIYETRFGNFSYSFVDEVAKYLGESNRNPLLNAYHNKYINQNRYGIKNDTIKITGNLYTLFREYNIPAEAIMEIISQDNANNINYDSTHNYADKSVDNFSEEEIEAIANLDEDALNELFVTDYCIVKGRSIYTPEWLYCHSLEDYVIAEITPDDVKEKLSYFYEFPYDDEAAVFFGDKLSEFTGETVIFQDWETKLAETEE